MRKCNRCGLLLPDEAYYPDLKNLSGLAGRCKVCKATGQDTWTTEDELRHVRKLGRHARPTLGRIGLLEAYLVIGEGRNWGSMDKEACLNLAQELLDVERAKENA